MYKHKSGGIIMEDEKIEIALMDELIKKLNKTEHNDNKLEKPQMYAILEELGHSKKDVDKALCEIENEKQKEAYDKINAKIYRKKILLIIAYFFAAGIMLFLIILPSLFFDSKTIESSMVGIIGIIGLIIGATIGASFDNFWAGLFIGMLSGGVIGLLLSFLMTDKVGQIIFFPVFIGGSIFLYFKYVKAKIDNICGKSS